MFLDPAVFFLFFFSLSQDFLSDISAMLDATECLSSVLIDEELVDWKRRQQKSCIGAPDDTSLEQLEKW